jgi:hypothetical protein
MNDLPRRLKTLRRTVLMLETELRQGQMKGWIIMVSKGLDRTITSETRHCRYH